MAFQMTIQNTFPMKRLFALGALELLILAIEWFLFVAQLKMHGQIASNFVAARAKCVSIGMPKSLNRIHICLPRTTRIAFVWALIGVRTLHVIVKTVLKFVSLATQFTEPFCC